MDICLLDGFRYETKNRFGSLAFLIYWHIFTCARCLVVNP